MNGDALTDAYRTEADAALIAGNLALADALNHEILRAHPDDPAAMGVMAHIAGLLGLDEAREAWRARLGVKSPQRDFGASDNPALAAYLAGCGRCEAPQRFLLIKAWGAGFWSDVFHVLGALLLAEITGRAPYIHWGANSLFSPDPDTNAYPMYFSPLNADLLDDIGRVPAQEIFPAKWRSAGLWAEDIEKWEPLHSGREGKMAGLYLLNRPERLLVSDFYIGVSDLLPWVPAAHPWRHHTVDQVVRALVAKYLHLQDEVANELAAFRDACLSDGRFVAVHLRGSDKILEVDILNDANRAYEPSVRRALSEGYRIFLLTDSVPIANEYRRKYGDYLVCRDVLRTDTLVGIHRAAAVSDRYRTGREVLIDVMAGAGCDRFLGNGASNPSCMIDFLIEDPDRKHMFILNQNRARFLGLHRDF